MSAAGAANAGAISAVALNAQMLASLVGRNSAARSGGAGRQRRGFRRARQPSSGLRGHVGQCGGSSRNIPTISRRFKHAALSGSDPAMAPTRRPSPRLPSDAKAMQRLSSNSAAFAALAANAGAFRALTANNASLQNSAACRRADGEEPGRLCELREEWRGAGACGLARLRRSTPAASAASLASQGKLNAQMQSALHSQPGGVFGDERESRAPSRRSPTIQAALAAFARNAPALVGFVGQLELQGAGCAVRRSQRRLQNGNFANAMNRRTDALAARRRGGLMRGKRRPRRGRFRAWSRRCCSAALRQPFAQQAPPPRPPQPDRTTVVEPSRTRLPPRSRRQGTGQGRGPGARSARRVGHRPDDARDQGPRPSLFRPGPDLSDALHRARL